MYKKGERYLMGEKSKHTRKFKERWTGGEHRHRCFDQARSSSGRTRDRPTLKKARGSGGNDRQTREGARYTRFHFIQKVIFFSTFTLPWLSQGDRVKKRK